MYDCNLAWRIVHQVWGCRDEKKCKIQSSLKVRLVNRHIFLYKSDCTQNQVIQLANLHIYFFPHAQGQHIVFFFKVHMKICFLMFLKIARSHMILFIIFHRQYMILPSNLVLRSFGVFMWRSPTDRGLNLSQEYLWNSI